MRNPCEWEWEWRWKERSVARLLPEDGQATYLVTYLVARLLT